MRRYGFLAAILFLVLVNAVLFLRLAYNRGGEPEGKVTLTGREVAITEMIALPDTAARKRPGSLVRLTYSGDCPWFDAAKLEAVGFDCRVPPGSDAPVYLFRMRPRQTYVVLEYEGPAYEAWRRETEKNIKDLEEKEKKGEIKSGEKYLIKQSRESLISRSRLFPMDLGNDAAALRQRYPDRGRFIIAPGLVRIMPSGPKGGQPRGAVSHLLVESLSLSDRHRDQLEKILRGFEVPAGKPDSPGLMTPEQRPRLRFTLCYGQNYEPWVADIRLVEEAK